MGWHRIRTRKTFEKVLVRAYGVLMVKPRTAGMREMRAAAATVNFMSSFRGEKKEERVWGRRCGHERKGVEFNVHSTTRRHLADLLKLRLISRAAPIRRQGKQPRIA